MELHDTSPRALRGAPASRTPEGTIGDGWSDDPAERAAQVEQQREAVSKLAELLERFELEEWEWDNGYG